MKSIIGIFVTVVIGVMAFVSCEPVENRLKLEGAVTEADVRAKVKIEVVKRDSEKNPGKQVNSNFVNLSSE